jgi:hypothetical protein
MTQIQDAENDTFFFMGGWKCKAQVGYFGDTTGPDLKNEL